MTDFELLQRAAKAAGLLAQNRVAVVDGDDRLLGIKVRATERDRYRLWNPLASDGDALRLMVSLHLGVAAFDDRANVYDGRRVDVLVHHDGDAAAATRRAIVQAAAAMCDN